MIIIAVLVLSGISVYAIQGLDEDKSTRILADDGYATLTTNTVGGTIETTKDVLQSVVDNTSYEGLHVTDTYSVFSLDKTFLQQIVNSAQGTVVSFHFGYNTAKTEVAFNIKDSNNNALFSDEGRCLGEIPYTAGTNSGVKDIVLKDPAGNYVALSAYYPDAQMIHWQLDDVGNYVITTHAVSFTDTTNHWGLTYISFLSSRGVADGMGANLFAPNDSLTRAQFVTFLARVAHADVSAAGTNQFSDVVSGSWYYNYVGWAYQNGITSGISATEFAPETRITREQMAVFAVRLLNYLHIEQAPIRDGADFPDSASISSWAKTAVASAQTCGIINGRTEGGFDPKGNATRAEAATVCSKIISYMLIMPL